jgi:hypothetical protein
VTVQEPLPREFALRARWLTKCRQAVDSLAPQVAAASLLMLAANFEGLTPITKRSGRPRNLLAALSDDFECHRREIMAAMSTLCNGYCGD